ncbi:hypothetical protein DYI25_06470 [Mesobacillus boroniphilus]|uniref:Uncharacterized protein n=1 Tax=Mesobacillus boroniphilus TaxID=308892 RepID=A0A944CIZ0_9BACI|nr:hypothetical protein [Mesobacillus boroniphilus]MBS8264075.1 hypothetical protein [Mesobacillus boroniphilus]
MDVFLTIAAGAGILFAIAYFSGNGSKKKVLLKESIPDRLGLLEVVPASAILNKLENALPYEYINQVKLRFLSDHPEVSDDEFEWRLFELKRYFFLNSVMKNTPMFSSKVDEVWHEMLMFTKQYESFSEKYLGKMLHHTPNLEPEPAPQQRAFFDWVFAQLFDITEYTWQAWGDFFHYPMDVEVLQRIESLSDVELKKQFFNVNEENQELVNYLITKLRSQLRKAQDIYTMDRKGSFGRPALFGDLSGLSLVMVFYSYYYFDEYWDYTQVYAYSNQAHGTSGCSAVFCGSGGINDSHNDGGGHSCSSSCSSCGGGCSS